MYSIWDWLSRTCFCIQGIKVFIYTFEVNDQIIKLHYNPKSELVESCSFLSSSQAVLVDRTMYISGQVGIDPATGELVKGGVQAEARQVIHGEKNVHSSAKSKNKFKNNIWKFFMQALVNMGEILKAAGCGFDNGKEKPTSNNNNLI